MLRAANAKTRYEDHVSDICLTRLRVLQKRYGTSLSPTTQFSLATLHLNHFSTMQEAARQINDNAIKLRLSNHPQDQRLALEGMRDFVLMARTLRRNAKRSSGFSIGQQLETVGLYGGTISPSVTYGSPVFLSRAFVRTIALPVPPLSTYANDPQSLLFFARKMGRNDIASQLQREWTDLESWNRLAKLPYLQFDSTGLDTRDIVWAQMGDWLGTLLLAGLPSLLGLAVLSSVALRFIPTWRREPESYPSSTSPFDGVSLTLLSVLVLSLSAIWTVWQLYRVGYTGLLLLEILRIFGVSYGVRGVPPVWQSHFPALLAVLFALGVAARWESRRQGVAPLITRLRYMGATRDDGLTHFDLSPLLALIGSIAGSTLCVAALFVFLVLPGQNSKFRFLHEGRYAVSILVLTTLYLATPLIWRLRSASSWTFVLAMTRRFAWSQLVCLSLLWGILWMIAAPAQKRFDAAFTHQIQVGEFQITRKQMGL